MKHTILAFNQGVKMQECSEGGPHANQMLSRTAKN